MQHTGPLIASAAQRTLGLLDALLKDIPADRFARLARGADGPIQANHPAWAYGHLAMYPTGLISHLGGDGAMCAPPAEWGPLFDNGTPCLDDPDASIYPAMDDITDLARRGYAQMIDVIRDCPDDRFAAESPEPYNKAFPTLGVMATFMATSHVMLHLGQVSTWRRAEGIGSAM